MEARRWANHHVLGRDGTWRLLPPPLAPKPKPKLETRVLVLTMAVVLLVVVGYVVTAVVTADKRTL